MKLIRCDQCEKEINDIDGAYNQTMFVLRDSISGQVMHFCNHECLEKWVNGK